MAQREQVETAGKVLAKVFAGGVQREEGLTGSFRKSLVMMVEQRRFELPTPTLSRARKRLGMML